MGSLSVMYHIGLFLDQYKVALYGSLYRFSSPTGSCTALPHMHMCRTTVALLMLTFLKFLVRMTLRSRK